MPRSCAPIAVSLALSLCAAWNAAPPSMIAMRLPTGVPLGNELSESGRVTRMRVGIDLQHLADHGAEQRLVALAG